MNLDALESYFEERQGHYIRYFCELNKEPEKWEEGKYRRV